tara:strand:+ start:69 stop:530 length:462 start_codon:yes stop_codon:yes gene_type:complete
MSKRKMPSKPPICREWENEPEMIVKKKRFGWDKLPESSCWRCGKDEFTFRCHIHSHCFDENDKPSNLHLLCDGCHTESETYSGWKSGHAYYEWFKTYSKFGWEGIILSEMVKTIGKPEDRESDESYQERAMDWYKGIFNLENDKNQQQILINK